MKYDLGIVFPSNEGRDRDTIDTEASPEAL